MKLKNPKITFLINVDYTEIELYDSDSSTLFAKVKLTPKQLSAVLSRQEYAECEITVQNLNRLGKKHENKYFEFEIPEGAKTEELQKICLLTLGKSKMSEWKPDDYYTSQNSRFKKDGKHYARAIIRRWIDQPDNTENT